MNRNKVVLVDKNDNAIGIMDKMEAHKKGMLHIAFSVFIFNANGEMLIHQRAKNKYHGAGLWTNACCSHPQPDEDVKTGALERLQYEMGIYCNIENSFSFIYNTPVENGLIEYEYDYVFTGFTDATPEPHPDEVQAYKWVSLQKLEKEIMLHPQHYTYWFKKAMRELVLVK